MDRGEEFWFAGADPDKQVHGFIMKPHGYEKGKKYGMVFLVHGKSNPGMPLELDGIKLTLLIRRTAVGLDRLLVSMLSIPFDGQI